MNDVPSLVVFDRAEAVVTAARDFNAIDTRIMIGPTPTNADWEAWSDAIRRLKAAVADLPEHTHGGAA